MTNAKPTRGGYIKSGYFTSNLHTQAPNGYTILDAYGNPVADVPSCYAGNGGNTKAHAELIIEAFNVLTETGLTPRQLVDAAMVRGQDVQLEIRKQRDELLAFANRALISIGQAAEGKPLSEWETLRKLGAAAIASAKGGVQ